MTLSDFEKNGIDFDGNMDISIWGDDEFARFEIRDALSMDDVHKEIPEIVWSEGQIERLTNNGSAIVIEISSDGLGYSIKRFA